MSAFSEAIQASMVSNLDPMNGVIKQFASDQAELTRVQVAQEKLSLIDELKRRINEGIADSTDTRVIEGYQRMLKSFTS